MAPMMAARTTTTGTARRVIPAARSVVDEGRTATAMNVAGNAASVMAAGISISQATTR